MQITPAESELPSAQNYTYFHEQDYNPRLKPGKFKFNTPTACPSTSLFEKHELCAFPFENMNFTNLFENMNLLPIFQQPMIMQEISKWIRECRKFYQQRFEELSDLIPEIPDE